MDRFVFKLPNITVRFAFYILGKRFKKCFQMPQRFPGGGCESLTRLENLKMETIF